MARKVLSKPEARSSAKPRVARSERLETRVTDRQKELIAEAADLLGVSTSQFVIRSAVSTAKRILREDDLIRVNENDRVALVDALMNPAGPTEALKAAWKDFKAVAG